MILLAKLRQNDFFFFFFFWGGGGPLPLGAWDRLCKYCHTPSRTGLSYYPRTPQDTILYLRHIKMSLFAHFYHLFIDLKV